MEYDKNLERRYYMSLFVIFFYMVGLFWPAFAMVGLVPLLFSKILMVISLLLSALFMFKSLKLIQKGTFKWYTRISVFVVLLIFFFSFMLEFLMNDFSNCPNCP
jgi:hypothetical protein